MVILPDTCQFSMNLNSKFGLKLYDWVSFYVETTNSGFLNKNKN